MSTLTEFILARLGEDEAVARAATPGPWRRDEGPSMLADGEIPCVFGDIDQPRDRAHIARHDPARVLAQCAALRAVVEFHEPEVRKPIVDIYDDWCSECHHEEWPCPTLRALAAHWADHEDFREEWAL